MRSQIKFKELSAGGVVRAELDVDSLTFSELKAEFQKAYRTEVRASRELMLLAVGYHEQVRQFGGLDETAQQLLAEQVRFVEGSARRLRPASQRSSRPLQLTSSLPDRMGLPSPPLQSNRRSEPQSGSSGRLELGGDITPGSKVYASKHQASVASKTTVKPGTRFVREWGGKFHEVQALEGGTFAYSGKIYGSLSEIARVITGAHWSGPRFFGLKKPKRGSSHD